MMNDDIQDEGTVEGTEDTNTDTTMEGGADEGYQFEDASDQPSNNAPSSHSSNNGGGSGRYANEVFSKTIHAKFRTFYIDLKESHNGKFLKISEKSRGRKSTIMMDAEDVAEVIAALQEVQEKL